MASRFPDISSLVDRYGLGECCDTDAQSIVAAIHRLDQQRERGVSGDLRELGLEEQGERLRQVYQLLAANV